MTESFDSKRAETLADQLHSHSPQLAENYLQSLKTFADRGWQDDDIKQYAMLCEVITSAGWHSWTTTAAYIELCRLVISSTSDSLIGNDIVRLLSAGKFGGQLAQIIHEPATSYFKGLQQIFRQEHASHLEIWQATSLKIREKFARNSSLLNDYFKTSMDIQHKFSAGEFGSWIVLIADSSSERLDVFREIMVLSARPARGHPFSTAVQVPARLRGAFLENYTAFAHWNEIELKLLGEVLQGIGYRADLARDYLAALKGKARYLDTRSRTLVLECCKVLVEFNQTPLLEFVSVVGQLPLNHPDQVNSWVDQGRTFVKRGVESGKAYFALESSSAIEALHSIRGQVNFDDLQRLFNLFSEGITGERLQVRCREEEEVTFRDFSGACTDGRHVYLPEKVNMFPTYRENIDFYKVSLLHQLGFFESGTFEFVGADGTNSLRDFFRSFENAELAAQLFQLLEDARVDWYLLRRYKGIRRPLGWLMGEMLSRRPAINRLPREVTRVLESIIQFTLGRPKSLLIDAHACTAQVLDAVEQLNSPGAGVELTISLVREIYPLLADLFKAPQLELGEHEGEIDPEQSPIDPPTNLGEWKPPPVDYRGDTDPSGVSLQSPLESWEDALADLVDDQMTDGGGQLIDPGNVEIEEVTRGDLQNAMGMTLTDLDKPLPADERSEDEGNANLEEIRQILQMPAGFGKQAGIFRYDEWDYEIADYRKNWCKLHEMRPDSEDMAFIDKTLLENRSVLDRIKRQFQMLKPELQRKVKGLLDGEDIDLEGAIEAIIDKRSGISPQEKIYIQRMRKERDVAALFLLDMSASTDDVLPEPLTPEELAALKKAALQRSAEEADDYLSVFLADDERDRLLAKSDQRRIIDLEKESVVLMAEALEELGDDYSICGFSGYGRDQVDYYICKGFDERYDQSAKSRISAIKPCRSTRMGPAIRHATMQLGRTESRMKALIIISDGYPQDFDYGRDRSSKEYGIQDTTKALAEARQKGIQTFCLTVDQSGHDYLREMCPDNRYMILRDLEQLPSELSKVYEGLTT